MTRTPANPAHALAGVILLYGLTAASCRLGNLGNYRQLKDPAKLILVSHIAYLLVFLGTATPYTIAMVKVLFAPGAPANLLHPYMQRCIFFPTVFNWPYMSSR